MAVSKQIYTGTVYNLVQHSSYMNLTFIVNERKQNHSQCYKQKMLPQCLCEMFLQAPATAPQA